MLRRFCTLALALAMPLLTTAAVPDDVNLHNGYVLIVNHVRYVGEAPNLDNYSFNGYVRGPTQYSRFYVLRKDGSALANECCLLAGTVYNISLGTSNNYCCLHEVLEFVPRLCNIRGIPFGYAEFELVGEVVGQKWVGSYTETPKGVQLRRIDSGCP
jgi:hypothetical protein